jgi:hypothetical protein
MFTISIAASITHGCHHGALGLMIFLYEAGVPSSDAKRRGQVSSRIDPELVLRQSMLRAADWLDS